MFGQLALFPARLFGYFLRVGWWPVACFAALAFSRSPFRNRTRCRCDRLDAPEI